ncbi:hypothetical protein D3C87_1824470 [compost metagenome]
MRGRHRRIGVGRAAAGDAGERLPVAWTDNVLIGLLGRRMPRAAIEQAGLARQHDGAAGVSGGHGSY